PIADKLIADVGDLQRRVASAHYDPLQMAQGASELLDEVAKTKITGEEDRYSHTDLWDLAANIAGAQQIFTLLRPQLAANSPELVSTIEQRFQQMQQLLDRYRSGAGYADYSTLDTAARRVLGQQSDALAEALGQMNGFLGPTN